MKRFLIRVLLFLLPPAALLLLFEYSQRRAPHEFAYKAAYMQAHAPELEALVLGNSHLHRLNLTELGCKAFNLSYNNQSIDRDYQLWRRYRDRLTSLRCLIVPLSCWFHQNRSDGLEAWRTPFYTVHYGLPAPPLDLRKRFIVASPKIAVKRLGVLLRGGGKMQLPCDSLGSSLTLKANRRPDWEGHSGPFMARRHSAVEPANAAANREELIRLIEECAARNVRVVLVTTPTWHPYYENLSPEVVARTRSLGHEMQERFPGTVAYLDLLQDKRFTEEDFFDDSHLNYDVGGRKLARLLRAAMASGPAGSPVGETAAETAADTSGSALGAACGTVAGAAARTAAGTDGKTARRTAGAIAGSPAPAGR